MKLGPKDKGFLDRLSAEERDAVESYLVTRIYHRDATIISHLDESRDVFFVLEGRARAKIYSLHGKVVDYRDIHPGGIFGELAAVDGLPRSASVVALDRVKIGCLSEADFCNLVESRPAFAWAMMRHFSKQVRRMTERIFEFSTLVVRERLILELLRQADAAGIEQGRAEIHPAPTHFELAARISSHREAVSREMSVLAKEGLVEKRDGALFLENTGRLRDMIAE